MKTIMITVEVYDDSTVEDVERAVSIGLDDCGIDCSYDIENDRLNKKYKDIRENSYYEEFDKNCRQLGLPEVYKTKSKSQYERFLKMLQEKGIPCRGYMDDYNCIFEIRFL